MKKQLLILAAVLTTMLAGISHGQMFAQMFGGSTWTPLTLGPVAWWKMDDNAANKVVLDSAGANTGVSAQNTSAVHTDGINGGALTFNGNSDFVTVTHSSSVDFTNSFSVSFWCCPATADQNGTIAGKWTTGASTNNSWVVTVGQDVANNKWGAGIQQSDGTIKTLTPATTFSATTWYHGVLVAGVTNFALFINGAAIGSEAYDGTINSTAINITLGKLRTVDSIYSFNGAIDDVLFFNRALTPAEITQIYNWRQ